MGYGVREDILLGQRREVCGPPHPRTEHTYRKGQSLLRHRPQLKLMQISWCDGAGRLEQAGVPRAFLAGPSVYSGA